MDKRPALLACLRFDKIDERWLLICRLAAPDFNDKTPKTSRSRDTLLQRDKTLYLQSQKKTKL